MRPIYYLLLLFFLIIKKIPPFFLENFDEINDLRERKEKSVLLSFILFKARNSFVEILDEILEFYLQSNVRFSLVLISFFK